MPLIVGPGRTLVASGWRPNGPRAASAASLATLLLVRRKAGVVPDLLLLQKSGKVRVEPGPQLVAEFLVLRWWAKSTGERYLLRVL